MLREMSKDRHVVTLRDYTDLKSAMRLPGLPHKLDAGYNNRTKRYEIAFASAEQAQTAKAVLSKNRIGTTGVEFNAGNRSTTSKAQTDTEIGAGDMCTLKDGTPVVVVRVVNGIAAVKPDVKLGEKADMFDVPVSELVKHIIGGGDNTKKLDSADLKDIGKNIQ